jgi:hypothetical protein
MSTSNRRKLLTNSTTAVTSLGSSPSSSSSPSMSSSSKQSRRTVINGLNNTSSIKSQPKSKRQQQLINGTSKEKKYDLLKSSSTKNATNYASKLNNRSSNNNCSSISRQQKTNINSTKSSISTSKNAQEDILNKKQQQKQQQQSQQDNQLENHNSYDMYVFNNNYDLFTSRQSYKAREQFYERRLTELKEQLDLMKKIGQEAYLDSGESDRALSKLSTIAEKLNEGTGGVNYISQYVQEIMKLRRDSENNLSIVNTWYDRQKNESDHQYTSEQMRAQQEYQEKRRELKESLKNEYEDKKRQIELEKTSLDINMDVSEPKPANTRKLRCRRAAGPYSNNPNGSLSVNAGSVVNYDFMIDSGPIGCLDGSLNAPYQHSSIGTNNINTGSSSSNLINTSMSSASVFIQNGIITSSSSCASSLLGLGTGFSLNSALNSLNQFTSTGVNYYGGLTQPSIMSVLNSGGYFASNLVNAVSSNIASSSTQGSLNERKRKLYPQAITFNIHEDELNEDHKYLLKNLNNHNYKEVAAVSSALFSSPKTIITASE